MSSSILKDYCPSRDNALNDFQKLCMKRIKKSIHLMETAYISHHPEVKAMLEKSISGAIKKEPRGMLNQLFGNFFVRSISELDKDVKRYMKLSSTENYTKDKVCYNLPFCSLMKDLNKTIKRYKEEQERLKSPYEATHICKEEYIGSNFSSYPSSTTTMPEGAEVELTFMEEFMLKLQANLAKGIYLQYQNYDILYDCAYVEIMKMVEEAMDIPVLPIKEDINHMFSLVLTIAFEISERRNVLTPMQLKAKVILKKEKKKKRMVSNFKGVAPSESEEKLDKEEETIEFTPVINKFNRYPKDEFGVYILHPTYSMQTVSIYICPTDSPAQPGTLTDTSTNATED